ncbi:MAG: phospho-sugar mutase [Prevotellaceae bacterium]|jgi:phosphoglucomutase|nr:phospho-sugar mutase [Prevotellaceae bacterium]
MEKNIDKQILEKARTWLSDKYDAETRRQVQYLIDNDTQELVECFYRTLEFGTGGLRGIMGAGSNRMNKYTVGMATQGLANYLKKEIKNGQIKVAIAYDCRNNSSFFAKIAASVLSANDIKVYLFDSLRPTPELSFAVCHFSCHSGIVITASHNPKEYNGYKVYWSDGGQIVSPHDKNIIAEVNKIADTDEVKFSENGENIIIIGDEIDDIYLDKLCSLSLSPEIIKKHSDIKIVYTPLHGTGVKLVPKILQRMGFTNIINVPEQDINDGNFPTVLSPNPEESSALKMAIDKAIAINADLVMATDPDADRVGVAVRNKDNEFVLLNGNQTAAILTYYLLTKWEEKQLLKGNEYLVKTIVTSNLIKEIADKFNVECFDVLTGFKYIAEKIKENEGIKTFIAGGEESYGFLVGEFVRDKDAVMSCAMIAETAAWAKDNGKTFIDLLLDIYVKFGFYKEKLISLTKKGKTGVEEIQKMMHNFRINPPHELAGSDVIFIHDYQKSETADVRSNLQLPINQPKSNVLQFITEDGTVVSIRPSGTEPKIKFYISSHEGLDDVENYDKISTKIDIKIQKIIDELKIS